MQLKEEIERTALGHFTYLPKRLGFPITKKFGVDIINCGLDSSMFNIVFGHLKDHPQEWRLDIQNIISTFDKQPFAWWLPIENSYDLSSYLDNFGFIKEVVEQAMACDLKKLDSSSLKMTTQLEVHPVLTSDDLEDFIHVIEPYDKAARYFYENLRLEDLESEEKLFVGYVDDEAVTIGILYKHNQCSGIFSLLTEENNRGKGYGTDMMKALLIKAKENDSLYATLSATSDSGYRIYERLGFDKIGEFTCFEYKP